jgi:hypothetical protein
MVLFAGSTFRAVLVPSGLVTLALGALLGRAMRRAAMFRAATP